MADRKTEDLAIAYALGLVDPDQLELVRQRLQEDDAVWDDVAKMEEIAADLTLLAPQVSPDSSLCQAVMDRIDAVTVTDGSDREHGFTSVETSPAGQGRGSRMLAITGWAVAACLAIAATFLAFRNQEYRDAIVNLRAGESGAGSEGPGRSQAPNHAGGILEPGEVNAPNGELRQPGLDDSSVDALVKEGHRATPYPVASGNKHNYQLQQDLDALSERVADLKRVREERFQAVPGLARLTVIEMRSKVVSEDSAEDDSQDDEEKNSGNGSTKSELIAQVDGPDPLVAKNDEVAAPSFSDVLADGLVDSGFVALNPDPLGSAFDGMLADADIDADITGMPAPPAGDGLADDASDTRVPAPTGRESTDSEVTTNDEITADTQQPVPNPPVGSIFDPQVADVGLPGVLDVPGAVPSGAPTASLTSAFTIYDETTGDGSILVQNLPGPETGFRYQLWMVDSMDLEPMNVGSLPPLETGDGRIFFELGEAGYSPSEFFITKEVETGSATPTGEPLLFGPDLSGQLQSESRIGPSPAP